MTWTPTADEFRALQAAGLVTLALVFAPRVMPPLQPYSRLIGTAAVALYVLGGIAMILWHSLAG
jgi:hypothetical protein